MSIKNQAPYEDVHDAEEEMKFIQHNVVERDIKKRRQRISQVLGTRECADKSFIFCRVRSFFDVSAYTFWSIDMSHLHVHGDVKL